MAHALDANCFIRFFIQDDVKKAKAVEKLFKSFDKRLVITDVVFAELVWVLSTVYSLPKQDIIDKVVSLLKLPSFDYNRHRILQTLLYWQQHSIDFIDAYLATYSEEEKLEGIYSYDTDFDKIKTVKRFRP